MDSQFCPRCGIKLKYDGTYYSHIGIWQCLKCGLKRPTPSVSTARYPLSGVYNRYNTLAAISTAMALGIPANLEEFSAAFGRQEKISGVKILLSKNPAGFNESLRTAISEKPKNILIVLNDRVPDGRDISWIWDVDFEMLGKRSVLASGERKLDLGLRLKYAGIQAEIVDLDDGVKQADYVLATYSAMLEVRKILTGRKIL